MKRNVSREDEDAAWISVPPVGAPSGQLKPGARWGSESSGLCWPRWFPAPAQALWLLYASHVAASGPARTHEKSLFNLVNTTQHPHNQNQGLHLNILFMLIQQVSLKETTLHRTTVKCVIFSKWGLAWSSGSIFKKSMLPSSVQNCYRDVPEYATWAIFRKMQ